MPVAAKIEEKIEIPDDVNVEKRMDDLKVSGENGEVEKKFNHPRIDIIVEDDEIQVIVEEPSKKEKALAGTYRSHIKNMIKGVREDFEYKLKIIYSHFPMEVTSEGEEVVIKNFVGENKPRRAKIVGSTEVKIEGDQVVVKGPDKEAVAQTASNIESATKISKVDPRVFQDGIYITEKAGKPLR